MWSLPGKGFGTEISTLEVLCVKLGLKYYEASWEWSRAESILRHAFQEQSRAGWLGQIMGPTNFRGLGVDCNYLTAGGDQIKKEGFVETKDKNYSGQVVGIHNLCGLGAQIFACESKGRQG